MAPSTLAPLPSNSLGHTRVLYRLADGDVENEPVSSALTAVPLEHASPMRGFYSWRGKRNLEGVQFFATTGAHVPFESRLEAQYVLAADFDPDVVAISAQPVAFLWPHGTPGQKNHVPDFFIRRANGDGALIDVRAAGFVDKSKAQFDATAEVCDKVGWRYEVWTGLDRFLMDGITFISGYHRVASGHHQVSPTGDTQTQPGSKAHKGKGQAKSEKVGKNIKDRKSKVHKHKHKGHGHGHGHGHGKKPSIPKPTPTPTPTPAPTASFADFLAKTSVSTLARFDGGDAGATGYDANSKNYYTGQQLCTTADFCRTAWASDMVFDDQGRLIVGWGDWTTNMDSFGTDRVGVIAQDPLTGEHLSERVPLGTEAFDVIRQIDGHLWIPTTDPSDKPGAGQRSGNIPGVWVNDGADGSWRLIQGPAGMIHVFDVAVVGDDVYLAGSTQNEGAVVYKGTRAGGDFELIRSSAAVSGLPYDQRAWDRTYSIAADENGVYFFEDGKTTRGLYAYDPDTGSVTRMTGPNQELLGVVGHDVVDTGVGMKERAPAVTMGGV